MGRPLIMVSVVREEQPLILRSAQDDIAEMEFVLSHPSEARIHPTDEDLSAGAPGMEQPS
jgi:hypothetical protein